MRLLLMPLFTTFLLSAQEVPPGHVVDKVVCRENEKQSYAAYLPSRYSANRTWPVLYALDPGARGRLPVERFAEAAEKLGIAVFGSNNSRNGPVNVAQEAVNAMLKDTHARFAIDDSRIFVAGFSGGARLAMDWGLTGKIAGVIACSAGLAGPELRADVRFRLFATAGEGDFNFDEVYEMSHVLYKRGVPLRFAAFPGDHEWLPASLTEEALKFVSGQIEPAAPADVPGQAKMASRFRTRIRELNAIDNTQKRMLIQKLQRDAARTGDSPDRLVARRVLGGEASTLWEAGWRYRGEKRYTEAAQAFELMVLIQPERTHAWYLLAASQAGAGDRRGALKSLDEAIARGFSYRGSLEQDPEWEPLRKDPRFQAVLAKLSK